MSLALTVTASSEIHFSISDSSYNAGMTGNPLNQSTMLSVLHITSESSFLNLFMDLFTAENLKISSQVKKKTISKISLHSHCSKFSVKVLSNFDNLIKC